MLSWSSGKDGAWALFCLRHRADVQVVGLMTTINQAFDRVAMHSTRVEVLDAQAKAAGLRLRKIPLPWPCSNEEYAARMAACVRELISEGIEAVAFGDLFLEDIRAYRERQLAGTGLEPLFPLWRIPTAKLAHEMIAGGLQAKLVCVDPRKLDASFAGREFDTKLLEDLPADVDPCGENGEFHTCVYGGPMFRHPISVETGEVVERDGFVFSDLFMARNAV
jgi:uncharacterized protein (TIGR00290 family)